MAWNNSFSRNEGQYVSVKYISVYADCHNKKLLILNSPLVRINRSGSGQLFVYKYEENIFSSIESISMSFLFMSLIILFTADNIS